MKFSDPSGLFAYEKNGQYSTISQISSGESSGPKVKVPDYSGVPPEYREILTQQNLKRNSESVELYVYRNVESYDISTDRNNPKNTYLDMAILYNKKTQDIQIFSKVQTVANYPSTDADGNPVESCYEDTVAPGSFGLKVYTTTNVAAGTAGVIVNAKTIDGRNIDEAGNTENAKSSGRGLIHSNRGADRQSDYNTPRSKQCFILPYEDNKRFYETLKKWGVQDDSIIKGTLTDYGKKGE